MKKIKILMLCLITTFGYAQKKMSKTSQSIKVNKDVIVELNTSYVEIEIDTWNKNVVEVEAYIEGVKLSEVELEKALEKWDLKVDGSMSNVVISSTGGHFLQRFPEDNYSYVLKDLEYHLAELPEMPEMPEMGEYLVMPALPEMPIMPELPELPQGIKTITFDYSRYQEEGEAYLSQWSKKYEQEGGKELQKRMEEWAKKFAESGYQEKMKKWGEDYGKRFEGKWAEDMEKWGEEFGERFGKEWAEKMEIWGESFGKKTEERSKLIEKHSEVMEKRAEALSDRNNSRTKELMKRKEESKARLDAMLERKEANTTRFFETGNASKVKKVIKIKIPKKAKLKTNIRHGELKISSVIHNMRGDISHSFLVAEHIDGVDTSINVSYSPVMINTWNLGTLNLNFVDKAQIKSAQHLVLNSKSSNVMVGKLLDTAIIDGSFGDLTISDLSETFKNLNLVLENSDALINLPKDVDYTLYFKGNRSKFNNKATTQKTIRNYPDGDNSNRNIIVNAKFSSVIFD